MGSVSLFKGALAGAGDQSAGPGRTAPDRGGRQERQSKDRWSGWVSLAFSAGKKGGRSGELSAPQGRAPRPGESSESELKWPHFPAIGCRIETRRAARLEPSRGGTPVPPLE